MIVGIGHDVTEIPRIAAMLNVGADSRLLQRILTPAERGLARRREARLAEYAAGRFAAKEAVVKALGCGIGKVVGFADIEIAPGALGRPEVTLSPGAWDRLGLGDGTGYSLHLSITHTGDLASAFAVFERADSPRSSTTGQENPSGLSP